MLTAEVFVLLPASAACLCLSLLLVVTSALTAVTGTRRHLLFSPAPADSKNDVWAPPWPATPEASQSTSTSSTVSDRNTHSICILSAGLTDFVFCKKFVKERDFATFSRNILPLQDYLFDLCTLRLFFKLKNIF